MALISSVPLLMAPPSSLLEFHQESLEFRCVGVRIGNRRRKHVRYRARHFPGVLLDSAIALMDGNPDLIDLLPVDSHGPDALGNHRFRMIDSTRAGYLQHLSALDAEIAGQLHWNLDEHFGDELDVHL